MLWTDGGALPPQGCTPTLPGKRRGHGCCVTHWPSTRGGEKRVPALRREEAGIPWRRERQPTPVFLPGESHGLRSLKGYSPWGHKSQTRLSDSDLTSQIDTTWMSLTDIMQNKRLDTKELRIPCSLTRGKTDPTSSDRKQRDEVGTGPRAEKSCTPV